MANQCLTWYLVFLEQINPNTVPIHPVFLSLGYTDSTLSCQLEEFLFSGDHTQFLLIFNDTMIWGVVIFFETCKLNHSVVCRKFSVGFYLFVGRFV
jgi:hypothetical protein